MEEELPVDKNKAEEFKAKGNEEFKARNYHKAIEHYTSAIVHNPKEPVYFSNRATCFMTLKRYTKCLEDCNKALAIDPGFSKVLKRRGKTNLILGRVADSLCDYKKAIEADSKDQQAKTEYEEAQIIDDYLKAVEEDLVNDIEKAGRKLETIVEKCSEWLEVKFRYGECLIKKGSYDKANELINEVTQKLGDSNHPEILYLKAIFNLYKGNSELAMKILKALLSRDPDNKKASMVLKNVKQIEELKELGNSQFREKKFKEAIESYSKALSIDAHLKSVNCQLYANRGLCFKNIGEKKQALADCSLATELDNDYAKAFIRKGDLEMEMEEYEEAARSFTRANTLDPSMETQRKMKTAQQKQKQVSKQDLYQVLGVSKDATEAEIKKAYRKLALQYHPDRHTNDSAEDKAKAEKKFKEVASAYDILSDAEKRKRYDLTGSIDDNGFGGQGMGFHGGIDPSQIFQMFFQGGSQNTFNFGGQRGSGGGFDPFGGGMGGGGFPGGFRVHFGGHH